jgi:hypothetical protein
MFASTLDAPYHGHGTRVGPVASRFLRKVNMGAIAIAMFVALALLSNTKGNDAGPGKSSASRTAKNEIAIQTQMTGKVTVR